MQAFKSFIVKEIVFTVFLGLVAYILFSTVFKTNYFPVFWLIFGLVSILTGLLHYLTLQGSKKNAAKFTSHYMMVIGIKMMIYLAFITTYVLLRPEKASFFLISFFSLYMLYTIFEVVLVVKHLKNN